MYFSNGFVQLALLSSSAFAFFIPDHSHHTDREESSNSPSKRSPLYIRPQQGKGADSPPEPSQPINRRQQRNSTPTIPSLNLLPDTVRRDVESINSAVPPKIPNTAPVNHDFPENSYLVNVEFGSQNQTLTMLVDTGSPYTWVMGFECTAPACLSRERFDSRVSTTFQPLTQSLDVAYGSGNISGYFASDVLQFAGFKFNAEFGYANNVSDQFSIFPIDGILGLGRNDHNDSSSIPEDTIMETLTKLNIIGNKEIGIHLGRQSDPINNGEITFGGIDPSMYNGSLSWNTAIAPVSRWIINVDDLQIGSVGLNFVGKTAVLDTGSSFLMMPQADLETCLKAFPGYQAAAPNSTLSYMGFDYVVPCAGPGPIALQFNGIKYEMLVTDYLDSTTPEDGMCGLRLATFTGFEPNLWVIGGVFLKTVYSVFDYDNGRIGLGQRGGSTLPTPSGSSMNP